MNDKIEDLLNRYLKRETSIEEDQRIEKWLEEKQIPDPAWQSMNRADKDQWLSEVFVDIKTSIKETGAQTTTIKTNSYLWYKVAGVAAVLLMMFSLYLFWPSLEKRRSISDLTSISTPGEQKKQVILPDGTRVWLNIGSELKYPETFNDQSRAVYLSGEAYFDVKHDASKPFVIHTGQVITTVLGTAFNIKEDQSRHTVEVTVTRGKVSVADGDKLLSILTPKQQLNVDLLTGRFVKSTVSTDVAIAWQTDEIQFDDITFADAVGQLQQHFNVRIIFDNEKLKNCRFSGTALKGDRLDEILDAITSLNKSRWQKHTDGRIVIYGGGCD